MLESYIYISLKNNKMTDPKEQILEYGKEYKELKLDCEFIEYVLARKPITVQLLEQFKRQGYTLFRPERPLLSKFKTNTNTSMYMYLKSNPLVTIECLEWFKKYSDIRVFYYDYRPRQLALVQYCCYNPNVKVEILEWFENLYKNIGDIPVEFLGHYDMRPATIRDHEYQTMLVFYASNKNINHRAIKWLREITMRFSGLKRMLMKEVSKKLTEN